MRGIYKQHVPNLQCRKTLNIIYIQRNTTTYFETFDETYIADKSHFGMLKIIIPFDANRKHSYIYKHIYAYFCLTYVDRAIFMSAFIYVYQTLAVAVYDLAEYKKIYNYYCSFTR